MAAHFVIIGGGFTGLTAARALASSPHPPRVTVLESGPAMGGLAQGFPLCGTNLEKTYHYLLLGDSAILDLVHELGLDGELLRREGSVGICHGGHIYPFMTPWDLLRFTPCSFTDRIRLGLAMFRLQHSQNWQMLERETARDWLSRHCGPSAMRAIWDPLLRGKFDVHWDRVSMAWLWARIHTRANSRAGGSEVLIYPQGGFATIVRRMTEDLDAAGATLRTNARVARIETTPQQRIVLTTGETLHYDRCLFTGPCDAFARLLPADNRLDDYRRQLASITYLGAICVVLVTDQQLTRHHWLNVHDPDAPFLVMINHTALLGTRPYQGRHVYYLGCYRPHDSPWFAMGEDELLAQWLAYLGRMIPGFDAARLAERHVFRFRNAQHVVDCDYASRIPDVRTPLPGVYLGNFAQIFPFDRGTNFSVRDGLRLAELMMHDARNQR